MRKLLPFLFLSFPILAYGQCKLTVTKDPFTKVETKMGMVDNSMVHIASIATTSKGDSIFSVVFSGVGAYRVDNNSKVLLLLADDSIMELHVKTPYQTTNGPLAVNGVVSTSQLMELGKSPIKMIRLAGVEINGAVTNGYDINMPAAKLKKLQEIARCFFQ